MTAPPSWQPAGKGSGGGAALSECIYGDGSLIVSMKTDSKALYDRQHSDATAKGATDVPGGGDSAFDTGTAQTGLGPRSAGYHS
jgi:hypothetical protein